MCVYLDVLATIVSISSTRLPFYEQLDKGFDKMFTFLHDGPFPSFYEGTFQSSPGTHQLQVHFPYSFVKLVPFLFLTSDTFSMKEI